MCVCVCVCVCVFKSMRIRECGGVNVRIGKRQGMHWLFLSIVTSFSNVKISVLTFNHHQTIYYVILYNPGLYSFKFFPEVFKRIDEK